MNRKEETNGSTGLVETSYSSCSYSSSGGLRKQKLKEKSRDVTE